MKRLTLTIPLDARSLRKKRKMLMAAKEIRTADKKFAVGIAHILHGLEMMILVDEGVHPDRNIRIRSGGSR